MPPDVPVPAICAKCSVIFTKYLTERDALLFGIDPNRALPQDLYLSLCPDHTDPRHD